MKMFNEEWGKLLSHVDCGGYYSAVPCRAKACKREHDYCKNHKKLLKINGDKIGKKD